jgi:hypothetical protein
LTFPIIASDSQERDTTTDAPAAWLPFDVSVGKRDGEIADQPTPNPADLINSADLINDGTTFMLDDPNLGDGSFGPADEGSAAREGNVESQSKFAETGKDVINYAKRVGQGVRQTANQASNSLMGTVNFNSN